MPPSSRRAAGIERRIDLYSPRVRHSTIAYLRLRLLELHEEGLDRARAAIERRLNIDELLARPAELPPVQGKRDAAATAAAAEKAKCSARRNDEP